MNQTAYPHTDPANTHLHTTTTPKPKTPMGHTRNRNCPICLSLSLARYTGSVVMHPYINTKGVPKQRVAQRLNLYHSCFRCCMKIVIWNYHTFEYNIGIKHKLTKHLKESCYLRCNQHFPFKYFPTDVFDGKISPK